MSTSRITTDQNAPRLLDRKIDVEITAQCQTCSRCDGALIGGTEALVITSTYTNVRGWSWEHVGVCP